MTIQDLLQLSQGSVLELEKLAGEPLDIFINGKQVARGEAVIVNEKFGVRITDILSPEDRMGGLR
jgi:flagellar motor switch protein FliN/FliY